MTRRLHIGGAIAAACALVALGCAGNGDPEPEVELPPARVEIEVLGGFATSALPLPPPRIALVLDATRPMARPVGAGASALVAARAGAARLVRALPGDAQLDAWVVGAERGATCATPAWSLRADAPPALLADLDRVRAEGIGSLSRALVRAADAGPGAPAPDRVIAFTTLESACPEDLCAAAERLAEQGVRLDLVLLGGASAPRCLATIAGVETGEPVLGETLRAVPFCVETLGPDAAVHVCSESGGLPVVVPDERVAVRIRLDPPLRLERRFPRGTRWRLQVLDFPATDPPERQWRWQQVPPETLGTRPQADEEEAEIEMDAAQADAAEPR